MPRKQLLTIEEIWDHIETWLSVNTPPGLVSLNPGASEQKIAETEEILSVKFPEDFIQFYLIHDGEDGKNHLGGVIGGENLLSLDRIVLVWKQLKHLGEGEDLNFELPKRTTVTQKSIKKDWWNSKWIPITHGEGHICLDFDPTEVGKQGQVIACHSNDDDMLFLGRSVQSWLNKYVKDLEAGKYLYSKELRCIINKMYI
jgi:cell wall assembly regulator SMI1